MGVSDLKATTAVVWPLNCSVAVLVSTWVVLKLFQAMKDLWEKQKRQKRMKRGSSNKTRFTTELVIILTGVCTLCFYISLWISLITSLLLIDHIYGVSNDRKEESASLHQMFVDDANGPLFRSMLIIDFLFQSGGYSTLSVIAFERLRLTFSQTKYKLSKSFVKLMHVIIGVSGMLTISMIIVFSVANSRLSSEIGLLVLIGFPLFSFSVLWLFWRKSTMVARSLVAFRNSTMSLADPVCCSNRSSDAHNQVSITTTTTVGSVLSLVNSARNNHHSSSQSTNTFDHTRHHHSSLEKAAELMQTSVRLTIATGVAILTTTLAISTLMGMVTVRSSSLVLIACFTNPLDVSLNLFCLLSTYQCYMGYYLCVFGRLHEWVIHRLRII